MNGGDYRGISPGGSPVYNLPTIVLPVHEGLRGRDPSRLTILLDKKMMQTDEDLELCAFILVKREKQDDESSIHGIGVRCNM
jgi:hypothetical protein